MSKFTPTVAHLPLKIIHNFPYKANATISEKKETVTAYLQDIMSRGFGGVVSNVCTRNYLKDEQEWEIFTYLADECERLGLRLWIYDEDGYPSGGASGLTLAAHPEYEAQAVAMVKVEVEANASVTIPLPFGHTHFLYAGVYVCDEQGVPTPNENGEYIPVSKAICTYSKDTVTLSNPCSHPCTAFAFVQKPLYEGTHCIHNVYECRRYIDVTNPDAVAEFLRNTYDQYANHVPEHFHAGAGRVTPKIGQIEAFFTDEPSFMGCYINKGLVPGSIKDAFDEENMPLYPVLSYGRDVANAFASTYGYDLFSNFISIFAGESTHAQKVRQDYYTLLSNLYETAFFAQISNWCQQHNISFSGHLLLEDCIVYHTVFEGNYFSLLRHMHFPGIDMLHSIPAQVRQFAFTPKLVSSVAHAYHRPHVMSEASAHAQGNKVTNDEMYASLCAQYALGADIFTYYYREQFMDPQTYTTYNHALGRIDQIMEGTHKADVLLYYPIDVFRRHHKPSDAQYGTYTQVETDCQNHLMAIQDTLLDNQIDFDYVDDDALSHMWVDDAGRLLTASQDEAYHLLIVPPMDQDIDISAIVGKDKASRIAVLTLTAEDMAHLDALPSRIKESIPQTIPTPVAVDTHQTNRGVLRLMRFDSHGKCNCLFVNTNDHPVKMTLDIYHMADPVLYDPMTDEVIPCSFEKVDKYHTFTITMETYQSLIVREKSTL